MRKRLHRLDTDYLAHRDDPTAPLPASGYHVQRTTGVSTAAGPTIAVRIAT